jgi:hypothetical protein
MRSVDNIKEMLRRGDAKGEIIIMKADLHPGTDDYSDALKYLLHSMASSAAVMDEVNKALERVGMSMGEYRKTKDYAELNKKLEKLKSEAVKRGDKDLDKFIKAVKTLRKAYGKLEGANEQSGVEFAESQDMANLFHGGDHVYDELEGYVKEAEKDMYELEKDAMKAERKLIMEEFNRIVGKEFEAFVSAIKAAAKQLGEKIPISDKTADLRDLLDRIQTMTLQTKYLYLALTGFYRDTDSIMSKDSFVDGLRMIKVQVDDMMESSLYKGNSLVSAIGRHASELISVVDTFSDLIQQKFGGNEAVKKMIGAAEDKPLRMAKANRSSYDLASAINEFKYYHYIAKLRDSMEQTGKELSKYGKDYKGILGDAVAARLETVESYYKNLVLAARAQLKDDAEKQAKVVDLIKERYKSIKGLYKAVQAVDLYLKDWTDSAVKNLDDLRDIKAMIANTDIIANWFTDAQGDSLCKAFDRLSVDFDNIWKDDNNVADQVTAAAGNESPEHYYVRLNAVNQAAAAGAGVAVNPGRPQDGAAAGIKLDSSNVEQLMKMKDDIDDVVMNTQALKNITSMFVTIGDKLGEKQVRRGNFMTPSQLYSALSNYLATSSLKLDYKYASPQVGSKLEDAKKLLRHLGLDPDTNKTADAQAKRIAGLLEQNMGPNMFNPIQMGSGSGGYDNIASTSLAAAPPADLNAYLQTMFGSLNGDSQYAQVDTNVTIHGNLITNRLNATALMAGVAVMPAEMDLDTLDKMPFGTDREKALSYIEVAKAILNQDTVVPLADVDKRFMFALYAFTLEDWINMGNNLSAPNAMQDLANKLNTHTSANKRYFVKPYPVAYDVQVTTDISNGVAVPSILTLLYILVIIITNPDNIIRNYIKMSKPAPVPQTQELVFRFSKVADIAADNDSMSNDIFAGKGGLEVGPFEDKLFARTIKAIGAKVLTVLGLYDMLELPGKVNEINPVRMMLGGADTSVPQVEVGAMSLYFRLVLLAEWYRDILTPNSSGDAEQIAMIPDAEGPFGDFIYLIFYEGKDVTSGEYDEFLLRKIVHAINKIYHHFRPKHGERTVSEIYNEFRDEINRRYGVVSLEKYQKWVKFQEEKRKYRLRDSKISYDALADTTDYAILPDEGEFEMKNAAPSDKYASYERDMPGGKRAHKHSLEKNYYDMLKKFREDIESKTSINKDIFKRTPEYATLVMRAVDSARKESSKDKQFDIVRDLVQTSGSLIGIVPQKLLMAHESVMLGLQSAHAMLQKLEYLEKAVVSMDVKTIREMLKEANIRNIAVGNELTNARTNINNDLTDARNYIYDETDYLGSQGANSAYANIGGTKHVRAGCNNNQNIGQLINAAVNADFTARIAVKVEDVMRDLLELLFNFVHKSNGLVDIRFPQTKENHIHLDFSRMKSYLETLMKHIKDQLDLLRAELDPGFVKKLEGGKDQEGTYYYMQEKLVNKYLRRTKPDEHDLTWIAKKVNEIFHELVKDTEVVDAGVNVDSDGAKQFWRYEHYGEVFADILFYNSNDSQLNLPAGAQPAITFSNHYGVAGSPNWINPDTMWGKKRMWDLTRGVKGGKPEELKDIDEKYRFQINGFNDSEYAAKGPLSSIFFRFNEAMHNYLQSFYDINSNRIYVGLIQGLANGAFSDMVMGDNRGWLDTTGIAIDLAAGNGRFGIRGDPNAGNILFRSTAAMMKNMVLDRDRRTNTNIHLIETMAEVPPYMKEKLRSNLPLFRKMFELMIEKIEFLKAVIARTSVSVARKYQNNTVAAPTPADVNIFNTGVRANITGMGNTSYVTTEVDAIISGAIDNAPDESKRTSSKIVKVEFDALMDRLSAACYTMVATCDTVLKEVINDPIFHQVGEGSIREYRERYGRLPFMPLSLASVYWQPDAKVDQGVSHIVNSLFPDNTIGTDEFKMEYGIRGLLLTHDKLSASKAPGLEKIVEGYNDVVGKAKRISRDKYMSFASMVVANMRCLGIDRYFIGLMDKSSDRWSDMDVLQPNGLKLWETRGDVSLRNIINVIRSN